MPLWRNIVKLTQTKKSERREIVQEYLRQYNPYEQTPRLGYRVAEMSRYAAEKHCKISDLSAEEAELFAVKI